MAKKDGSKAPEARIDTDDRLDETLRELEEQARADARAAASPSEEDRAASEPAPAYDAPAGNPSASSHGLRGTAERIVDWVDSIVPGNRNAAIGAIVGLIAAVCLFILGIWRTLVVALLIVCGIAVGQVFDGDPKIIRAVKRLIERSRER